MSTLDIENFGKSHCFASFELIERIVLKLGPTDGENPNTIISMYVIAKFFLCCAGQ